MDGALLDLDGLLTYKNHEIIGLSQNIGLGLFKFESRTRGNISSVGKGT